MLAIGITVAFGGAGTVGAAEPVAPHASPIAAAVPETPVEDRRTPDQTFLTFPEWYLVHSPAEYAAWLGRSDAPSRFPLFAHIGQFWQSYGAISREIERYPFNGGYHLMVMVIGVSTTVEYALKGVYERTVGRIAEGLRGTGGPVDEERFAARYAQDYVDFIRVDPWYKFDFASQLTSLWRDVPMTGPNMARKWERRYLLTTELLVKEAYARLIKRGTQTIYDAPKPVTAVWLSRAPDDAAGRAAHPDFIVPPMSSPTPASSPVSSPTSGAVSPAPGPVFATIPRYEGFTGYSRWLARQDVDFLSVAGNTGEIVVSELVPQAWQPTGARLLFEQPILTRPGTKRAVIALPIARLGDELRRADRAGDHIEHIYDF
ncbi:hypothetical protein ACQ859_06210 [Roseateles chitinivorans]|uniref:hypothetical protein n=1 Tax=Roseateles chitinivorans TaxID=2917965 RepID=UPI003D676F25